MLDDKGLAAAANVVRLSVGAADCEAGLNEAVFYLIPIGVRLGIGRAEGARDGGNFAGKAVQRELLADVLPLLLAGEQPLKLKACGNAADAKRGLRVPALGDAGHEAFGGAVYDDAAVRDEGFQRLYGLVVLDALNIARGIGAVHVLRKEISVLIALVVVLRQQGVDTQLKLIQEPVVTADVYGQRTGNGAWRGHTERVIVKLDIFEQREADVRALGPVKPGVLPALHGAEADGIRQRGDERAVIIGGICLIAMVILIFKRLHIGSGLAGEIAESAGRFADGVLNGAVFVVIRHQAAELHRPAVAVMRDGIGIWVLACIRELMRIVVYVKRKRFKPVLRRGVLAAERAVVPQLMHGKLRQDAVCDLCVLPVYKIRVAVWVAGMHGVAVRQRLRRAVAHGLAVFHLRQAGDDAVPRAVVRGIPAQRIAVRWHVLPAVLRQLLYAHTYTGRLWAQLLGVVVILPAHGDIQPRKRACFKLRIGRDGIHAAGVHRRRAGNGRGRRENVAVGLRRLGDGISAGRKVKLQAVAYRLAARWRDGEAERGAVLIGTFARDYIYGIAVARFAGSADVQILCVVRIADNSEVKCGIDRLAVHREVKAKGIVILQAFSQRLHGDLRFRNYVDKLRRFIPVKADDAASGAGGVLPVCRVYGIAECERACGIRRDEKCGVFRKAAKLKAAVIHPEASGILRIGQLLRRDKLFRKSDGRFAMFNAVQAESDGPHGRESVRAIGRADGQGKVIDLPLRIDLRRGRRCGGWCGRLFRCRFLRRRVCRCGRWFRFGRRVRGLRGFGFRCFRRLLRRKRRGHRRRGFRCRLRHGRRLKRLFNNGRCIRRVSRGGIGRRIHARHEHEHCQHSCQPSSAT